jgi:hypothetical protein
MLMLILKLVISRADAAALEVGNPGLAENKLEVG